MLLFGIGTVALFLAIYTIVQIYKSRLTYRRKIIWTLVVIILPFLGSIAYYLAKPFKV